MSLPVLYTSMQRPRLHQPLYLVYCLLYFIMVKDSAKHKSPRSILDLRGKHHVTQRALAHICEDIRKHGMVPATSRTSIQRHRTEFANQITPFGKLIQERSLTLKKGGCISLPFLHPAAMLWVCCQDCPEFKSFFSSVLNGQRLKLTLYSDEVVPGRELIKYNNKKLWTLYWSFLDFGPAALANEDAWFTGLTVRSSTVKKIAGGMAQMFKVYTKMFFNLADGCDFRIGVTLNVPPAASAPATAASAPATAASAQDRSLVFADLAMVVQDAEAHAFVFGWKGASSIKCCPLCLNIVGKHCNLVRDPTGGTIPVYTTDTSRFRLMSDKTFRSMQQRLHQLALHHPGELKANEQDFGFKWAPHSWLQDTELDVRPMRVLAFDWMHCWCEKGVWELELDACMHELSKHGHGGRQLHSYLQYFKWPKAYASGRDVFKGSVQEREREKDMPSSGSASEMLSVGPVVRKWLEDVIKPNNICPAQVASLLLCIAVMDLLLKVNTGCISPAELADAMARHYAAHVVAYGYTIFVPKHHFMLHIPRQLARFGFLIACFVHERKHKIAKRWAVPQCISPNRNYDRTVLEECTQAHMYSLREPLLKPCLPEAVQACPKVVAALRACGFATAESALTGQTARVQGRSITVGDVVLYKGDGHDTRVGEVFFHAMLRGELLVCLSHWPTRREATHWRKAVVSEEFTILPSACMLQSVIFTPTEVGHQSTVLVPAL